MALHLPLGQIDPRSDMDPGVWRCIRVCNEEVLHSPHILGCHDGVVRFLLVDDSAHQSGSPVLQELEEGGGRHESTVTVSDLETGHGLLQLCTRLQFLHRGCLLGHSVPDGETRGRRVPG